MTAIIESRPRIPRLAMVFIAAVVVMLLTAPKAGAWSETAGDFKIEKPYSSHGSTEVTVKEYTGNDTNITLPSTVTYRGTEYQVTAVGSNVLKRGSTLLLPSRRAIRPLQAMPFKTATA